MKEQNMDLKITPTFSVDRLNSSLRDKIFPGLMEREELGVFPIEIYQSLFEDGWLKSPIPKEHGGTELSTIDLVWFSRSLAYCSPGIFISCLGHILGFTSIPLYAQPELKEKLFKINSQNLQLWSFCMTELHSGTDVQNISTVAKKKDDRYIINGSKCFITNASFAEHLLVFAQLTNQQGQNIGVTAFYVPAHLKGVLRGPQSNKIGLRESNTAEIFFENVEIPKENLIGSEGAGLVILHRAIQRSKTLISAAAVGVCDRAFDITLEHLTNRVLYGKPLISKPVIKGLLATLETQKEAAWLLTCQAANTWDGGDFAVKEASMAKLFNTDMAVNYINECMELFGAKGFMRECEVQKLYRDIKSFEIVEGASFVQQILISQHLFNSHNTTNRAVA